MNGVSAMAVFLEGLLSFLSPCVLPLVPLYAAYLSGGAAVPDDVDDKSRRRHLLVNTLFFVLGIGVAFLLLGLGATTVGMLLRGYQNVLMRVGGVVIAALGLLQLGVFGAGGRLSGELRLPLSFEKLGMSPFTALLMGFFFSFAWTPCVGPALASVLVMAGAAHTQVTGLLLVGVYTLGFSLPFVAVGMMADTALSFVRKHRGIVRGTTVAGGVLLVVIGVSMALGWAQVATRYLAGLGGTSSADQAEAQTGVEVASDNANSEDTSASEPSQTEPQTIPAIDFELRDQYGETHRISDYQGKVVFINFWTTWCTYCKQEMPDLQAMYQQTGGNKANVIVFGVANPSVADGVAAADVSQEEVEAFLADGGYTYPTLMDTTGDVFAAYGITAYPTTFVIDKQGNISSYYPGAMDRHVMDELVAAAMAG